MNQRVEAAIEDGQKDMKAAAGLDDQGRPDEELACLPDRILTAGRPGFVGARDAGEAPSNGQKSVLCICRSGNGI